MTTSVDGYLRQNQQHLKASVHGEEGKQQPWLKLTHGWDAGGDKQVEGEDNELRLPAAQMSPSRSLEK